MHGSTARAGSVGSRVQEPFDPSAVLASAPVDPRCRYLEDSVRDGGWRSVLYRVGSRDDRAGDADLGSSAHARVTLTHRGVVPIRHHREGAVVAGLLAPGRSWLVPPGQPLRYDWSGADGEVRELAVLTLPAHLLAEAADGIEERSGRRPRAWDRVALAEDAVVEAVMRRIRRALGAGQSDLYAESASVFLAHHLLSEESPAAAGPEDRRVAAVIGFLRDNLHLPITLTEMAKVANLSRYHFLRTFRLATGETPRAYLVRLRLERSRRLLAEGDLSITEVAERCGFGSPSHFASAFRRAAGVSPRTYRAQVRAR